MSELGEIAIQIAAARARMKDDEKLIKNLTPKYYALLDAEHGTGRVEFAHAGMRYGRIMADASKFRLDDFVIEQPKIAEKVVVESVSQSLDEQALEEYLADHPEAQVVIQEYVIPNEAPRWKPPVPVKDE